MASSRQSGFPLAALFLLVAGVSLMLAGPSIEITKLFRQESVVQTQQYVGAYCQATPTAMSPLQVTIALFCGGLIGAVFGAVAGCMAERWFRGAVLGLITGGVAGILAALHLIVEPDLRTAAAGSAMLILGSLIYRLKFKQPDLPVPYLDQEFAAEVRDAEMGPSAKP